MTAWDALAFTVSGALIAWALLEAFARRWGK